MRHKHQQRQRRRLRSLVMLVLAAGAARGWAQGWGLEREDPLWTLYVPQLKYINTDVEAEQSSYKSPTGGSQNYTRVAVMPSMGVQWNNFLYHPDLLTYSLLFEPGYDWTQSSVSGNTLQIQELMLNGRGSVGLLGAKPYATTVSFSKARLEVQSDFFSTETVDMQNWGIFTGYHEGPVPVTLTLEQSEEDRTGHNQDFLTDQTKIGLHARNDRHKADTTQLDYQYSQFNNTSHSALTSYASESSSHHVILTDSEYFRKSTLYSSLYFTEREWQGTSFSDLSALCNYSLEHTPQLRSFYSYSLNDNFGDGYNAIQNSATAGLNHQLYESLSSQLDVHGSYGSSDASGSSQDSTTYGTRGSLNYSKRLGDWAHLSLGNGASYDLTDQHTSGADLVIPDESHTLPIVGPLMIHLNTPRVVSITSITKNNVPLDSTEWTANTATDPWQIQFFSGGAHSIANGDTISVTYVAQSNPSGSYSVFSYSSQAEVRFWQDRAGVHAGYNLTENRADTPGFVLQDVVDYQVGADVGWHNLHADAAYNDQHSTYYAYQNVSLSESYSTPVFLHSTVGVSCNQQWSVYPPGSGAFTNQTQNLAFYSYMLHYDWRPANAFSLNTEAGLQQQRGSLNDQDFLAARVYLNWMLSKLEIHLGYEHENQQYQVETRERDFIFLRLRRNF